MKGKERKTALKPKKNHMQKKTEILRMYRNLLTNVDENGCLNTIVIDNKLDCEVLRTLKVQKYMSANLFGIIKALRFALIALLLSCADNNKNNLLIFDNIRIGGFIVESINRHALAGVTVTISTKKSITNSNGYYSVDLPQSELVDNGALLQASITGFVTYMTIINRSVFLVDSPDTIFLTAK